MRHLVSGRKLGRDTNARKALLFNLTSALIVQGQVTTTLAKAKFVKPYVEKLVTSAKEKKLQTRRTLASRVTHDAFLKLTREIAPGFATRVGGYTRIIRVGLRRGDAAPLVRVEFLQWETSKQKKAKPTKVVKLNRITQVKSAKENKNK